MKVYEGGRSLDGAVVTVDGRPLDLRFDLRRFSPAGFEWTYVGAWRLDGAEIDAALAQLPGG